MPTFEEMQRESADRLVSFAKHAKLSVRSAMLETGAPMDGYMEKSYRELANVLLTDSIPLGVHKLQGNGINPLARDVRENAEKVSSILDSSIHEEKGVVDKRREAMVIVNGVLGIDGLAQWDIDGVAERLSALQDDRRVTRSTFTPDRARMLIEATDGFLMSVQNRVVGISTLYADDRVDNVAAFHDTASIDKEITRLDKERFRGASDAQRELWQHNVSGSDMGSSDSHFWSRSGSESSDHWLPDRSDSDSNRPFSQPNSPRSTGSRSEHGSASSERSSSGHSSSGSDGALHPFLEDWTHDGQATALRNFQAGRRLGASENSRASSGGARETPHDSTASGSWSGISASAEPGSAVSRHRDTLSPSLHSESTDEGTYVRNWPGVSQADAIRAFHSEDRHAALADEQALQDLAAGSSSSARVIPETRDASPAAGPSTSAPASEQSRKHGRSETPEEASSADGGSNFPSAKRPRLDERPARTRNSSEDRSL